MKSTRLILLLMMLLHMQPAFTQASNYFFRQITVDDGINDGVINTICQDKYGFIWIGSLGGLNRFDGYSTRVFSNVKGDTSSPYPNVVESSCKDKNGNIHFGYRGGMVTFNYKTETFERIKAVEGQVIFDMAPTAANTIFLASGDGLVKYNPLTRSAFFYGHQTDTAKAALFKKCGALTQQGNHIYFQAPGGIMEMDIRTEKLHLIPLPEINGVFVPSLAITKDGHLFVVSHGKTPLLMIDTDGKNKRIFYDESAAMKAHSSSLTSHVLCDQRNKIWVTTSNEGVLEYNSATGEFFKHKHQPNRPGSINNNLNRCMYEDDNGIIWVANLQGVSYFNPKKTLFSVIMPFADNLDEASRRIARGITEDKDGNYWFATVTGVSKLEKSTCRYSEWMNVPGKEQVLYSNSVRSIICDENNNIWIPNGGGVNRFNQLTKRLEFIGFDKLPKSFYFSANRDSTGRIWFGCRDFDGFYWYDPKTNTYHSIREIEAYQSFAGMGGRYVLEDSRHRMWFGFNGSGVGMYDPATKTTKHWSPEDEANTLIGGMVIDIKEDKNGVIWVSTANGITGIDTDHDRFQSFNSKNGLLSNTASALVVDDYNRLWVATSRGLNMIDSSRQFIKSFSTHDGLSINEFPEFPAVKLSNSNYILPSLNGYIQFNPLNYREENVALNTNIISYKIADKEYYLPEEKPGNYTLKLSVDENFFSFNLLALNYENKNETWYAYKLEGIDKEWHITQDRKAVYTNVPGGDYLFKFKASTNPQNWNVKENQLRIELATVFYKTVLFRLFIAFAAGIIVYFVYSYRINQQEQLYSLENKAYLLEQEKTRIMYDNLKQQLNPHFLFNSLTSLSGLIELDQRLATNFLEQMSKIYRYILKNSDKELVSLQDEINFVQVYVRLQQTRFKNGLQVNLNIDNRYMNDQVAPVTLQNLVENAIKHNIIDIETPLVVDIFISDDCIVVKNNLQAKSMVETSNKKGLAGLQNLYKYLTSKPVKIESTESYFAIHIPLIK